MNQEGRSERAALLILEDKGTGSGIAFSVGAHMVRPYGGAPGRRALQKRPVIRHCEEGRRPDAAIRATRSRRTDSHGPSGASE